MISIKINHIPWTSPQTPIRHLQTKQDAKRCQKTPWGTTDTKKCQQAVSNILKHHIGGSGFFWWCLLTFSGVHRFLCCLEMSRWCLGGYLRVSYWCVWMSVVLAYIWGCIPVLSPCRIDKSHNFEIALEDKIFLTWPYWQIKISKCPHVSFTKMAGLWHFFYL